MKVDPGTYDRKALKGFRNPHRYVSVAMVTSGHSFGSRKEIITMHSMIDTLVLYTLEIGSLTRILVTVTPTRLGLTLAMIFVGHTHQH
ncbi:hypothetical protein JR316_0000142 [Psilocybe cubensis]|uniref:Uncharacterized protein n=1 Tax=Psilocybe cubensis TaxID=181762 RepID=A0ACB8HDI4_PSICU|nr:hypothetical protein JR316_0000142 [Psilocybe cubensis]KAH9486078.1 hypothetical protein JR316_0000142 [Psilocybe cubensis]